MLAGVGRVRISVSVLSGRRTTTPAATPRSCPRSSTPAPPREFGSPCPVPWSCHKPSAPQAKPPYREEDTFGINASDTLMSAWQNLTSTIFAVTIGLVAVFMVVGGIVIMNIMLASVTERTHEIGIRKSLGARRRDILWQFVFESGIMASMGGIAGVLLAVLIARLVNMFFTADIPLAAVVVGVSLSTAVGLFFGIYPAKKAARLEPIEALRSEN